MWVLKPAVYNKDGTSLAATSQTMFHLPAGTHIVGRPPGKEGAMLA